MAELLHWNDAEADGSWDRCKLGGLLLPGVPKVKIRFPSGIDFQKPRKKKGARLEDIGDEPARITITLQVTKLEDVHRLPSVIRQLRPRSASLHDPLELEHPNANAWDIMNVVIDDIDIDHPDAVDGQIITFNCFEWIPQPEEVVDQKKKPKAVGDAADAQAWAPFVDDDIAGAGVPARNGAAGRNLGI